MNKKTYSMMNKNKIVEILRLAIDAVAEASMMDPVEYLKGEGYSKEEIRFILGT